MSLISDSLKKAQRMRGDPSGQASSVGGPGGGRGRGSSGLPLWLIGTGALALVAIAVGITAILLQPKSAPPFIAAVSPPGSVKSPPLVNGSNRNGPIVATPVIAVAQPAAEPTLIAAVTAPEPTKAQKKPDAKPSAEVAAFVDALRVTGVRSSGDGSKVLMNDHVYKVNDIVDRMLSVRLVEVRADGLTFEDGNGVQYSKNF